MRFCYKDKAKLLLWVTFTILAFFFSAAKSEPLPSPNLTVDDETASWPANKLLATSKSIRTSQPQRSSLLAKIALDKAQQNNNLSVEAQAHVQIGKLSKQAKDYEGAQHHFYQAVNKYKELGKPNQQVSTLIEYIKTLYISKLFDEGLQASDTAIAIAHNIKDNYLIALAHSAKANGYYKTKRFRKSIEENMYAQSYLPTNSRQDKKLLAITYHHIAQAYKHLGEPSHSTQAYIRSYELNKSIGDNKNTAKALKNIAFAKHQQNEDLSAIDYALRSLAVEKGITSSSERAEILNTLGMSYRNIGLYEKSLNYLKEAYEIYQKKNDNDKIANTSNQIGLIYTRLEQYNESLSFYQLSIDLKDKGIRPTTLAAAYRELATINYQRGLYAEAMDMATKALEIYKSQNHKARASHVKKTIGQIYRALDNQDAALESYEQSLDFARQAKSTPQQIKALNELGDFLIHKDPQRAILLLEESAKLANEEGLQQHALFAYKALRQIYEDLMDSASALYYAKNEIIAIEEINKRKDKLKVNQAKATLESFKLESELTDLRERAKIDELKISQKNNELQLIKQANTITDLELTKKRYAIIALSALFLCCLAIALLAYRSLFAYRKKNKELNHLAIRDPLTNCYNRRALLEKLDSDFSSPVTPFKYAIIVADIDHFKSINDKFGHNVGDEVIKGVSSLLQQGVRHNDFTARLGGEEFCILLPGADSNQAKAIAESLRNKIEATTFHKVNVTCSFGVTSATSSDVSTNSLMIQADKALYNSKDKGRNRTSTWQESAE